MRLIDADRAAADIICYFERNDLSGMSKQDLEYIKCIVSKFIEILTDENCTPTIDAQSVKRGRWILCKDQYNVDNDNGNYAYYCSCCNYQDVHAESAKVSFCWNCGADMRGGTDDA